MPIKDLTRPELVIKLNRLDLKDKKSRKVATLVRKMKLRSSHSSLTDVKVTRQSKADRLSRRISKQLEGNAHGIAGE